MGRSRRYWGDSCFLQWKPGDKFSIGGECEARVRIGQGNLLKLFVAKVNDGTQGQGEGGHSGGQSAMPPIIAVP